MINKDGNETLPSGAIPMLGWTAALAAAVSQVASLQMAAMESWQRSVAGINQEWFDEWVAHWGGGVPIDS